MDPRFITAPRIDSSTLAPASRASYMRDLFDGAISIIGALQSGARIEGIPLGDDVLSIADFVERLRNEHALTEEAIANPVPKEGLLAAHAELIGRIEAVTNILKDESITAGRRVKDALAAIENPAPPPGQTRPAEVVHHEPIESRREYEEHISQLLRRAYNAIVKMRVADLIEAEGNARDAGELLRDLETAATNPF